MNKAEAQFVRAGDLVTVPSPLTGQIGKSRQVLEVLTTSDNPQARLPLFVIDGERFPITYSLVNKA